MTAIGEVFARHLGLIGDLTDDDRETLLRLDGEIRWLESNEDILRSGDHPTHVVVVLGGLLHRYTNTPHGVRQIHSFFLPTDTPSVETLHIGVMDNNLGALTRSQIGLVPHSEMFAAMAARPNLTTLLWRETLVQGAIIRAWLIRNSQMLAHARLAHLFCELVTRARAAGLVDDNHCELAITHEDLGDALGMTAIQVKRTLMILRAGAIVDFRDGRLSVLDWEQLLEVGEFDPYYLHFQNGSGAPRAVDAIVHPR
ncbi:MAG: Crp/Fnr family transcriptional regulator [Alphaproteobacteria bacterium]|nr:Crp/Fnr family transcriptional regulator [Alphaproteobacteria bacterium]